MLRCLARPLDSARDRSRLPPLARPRPTGRCPRRGLDDLGRRRPRLPRRRRWGDRRQRRPRPPVGRRGDGRAGRPDRLRPRIRVHERSARGLRGAELGPHLPLDDPAIYPVSGGSEAIETALKLARSYHLARGEADRLVVFSRWGSYHGNTIGALDLSGRKPLRRPYEGWLGRFRHLSAAYPYRAGDPGANALETAEELAAELERAIEASGPRHCGGVRRRADRRCHARGGRASGGLLAGDRRGLPPPRRPAHRRRGHDRVRSDRSLVRARPLGRPARPPRRGQGRDVRLLAVRVRRGVRARVRDGHGARRRVRPRVHLQPSCRRGRGRPRGPADPRGRVPRRGERDEGRPADDAARRPARRPSERRRDPRPRTAWSASSSWPTAPRASRSPARPA